MRWTVLSDNRSDDSRLTTEHGLSILLHTDRLMILLDTGASDVFIRNAEQLGIDLSAVDYVFISHGHSDHAGGLRNFLEYNQKAQVIAFSKERKSEEAGEVVERLLSTYCMPGTGPNGSYFSPNPQKSPCDC